MDRSHMDTIAARGDQARRNDSSRQQGEGRDGMLQAVAVVDLTIGLAIVFAVRISGVIPVFSFLIIPAVGAIMIARKNISVVLFSAIISVLGAFFGLYVSYQYDFPAGSSIVAVLGGLFLLLSVFYIVKSFVQRKI